MNHDTAIRTLIAVFATAAAVAQAPTRIQVAAESRIEGSQIVLGDIAEIRPDSPGLAGLTLGPAPAAGQYRWLSRYDVEAALRRQGVVGAEATLEMPARVLVVRQAQTVSEGLIESAVREHFESRGDGYRVESVVAPSLLSLPPGSVEVRVEDPGSRLRPGEVSLKLTLIVDGRAERSLWVRARLFRMALVATAQRDLSAGARIEKGDVEMREVRLDRRGDYIGPSQEVAGTVLRRGLKAGEPIPAASLHRPDAVRRGDFVKLTAKGPGFVISTMGRARSGGAVGEMVSVENVHSKKVVHATVVGDKEVEVRFAGGRR